MTPTPTFVAAASVPVHAQAAPIGKCTFVARTTLRTVVRAPRSTLVMTEDYEIKQSEFVDADTDDDCGDGFIGEPDMDDLLGVAMPENLAGFEIREIQDTKNRDELVNKLKDIASRRRGIDFDRRKGLGMESVGDYLNNL